MALQTCPDCGREISASAPQCISCGRPMNTGHDGWIQAILKGAVFVGIFVAMTSSLFLTWVQLGFRSLTYLDLLSLFWGSAWTASIGNPQTWFRMLYFTALIGLPVLIAVLAVFGFIIFIGVCGRLDAPLTESQSDRPPSKEDGGFIPFGLMPLAGCILFYLDNRFLSDSHNLLGAGFYVYTVAALVLLSVECGAWLMRVHKTKS